MRAFILSLALIALSFVAISPASALTGTENFGSSPGSITSNLTVREGGNAITRTTATACYASFGSYSGFTGSSLHLYGVRNDVVFTFSATENVTSFSFQTSAINGINYLVATYEGGATSQFQPPDNTALQTVTFTGTGARILSFKVVGTPSGSTCNGSGTNTGDNDYWIMDNISWTYTANVVDSTPPTFTNSSSFSVNENISTLSNAATIKVSESSTITITAGVDSRTVSIVYGDSTTAFIRFVASPNFELPTDFGANNVYEFTVTATDPSSNSQTQSISITVLDVLDTLTLGNPSYPGSISKGVAISVSVSSTLPGKALFTYDGKRIPNCIKVSTTGSSPNFVVTCVFDPAVSGSHRIEIRLTPTDVAVPPGSVSAGLLVSKRTNNR